MNLKLGGGISIGRATNSLFYKKILKKFFLIPSISFILYENKKTLICSVLRFYIYVIIKKMLKEKRTKKENFIFILSFLNCV